MPKPTLLLALSLLLTPALALPLDAWGALGHRVAATAALKDLPPDLAAWFLGQEEAMRDHANDPDHWKEHDPLEGPKHFLDCEHYGGASGVPRDEAAARARLGEERFQKTGQVPWAILARAEDLTRAFRSGDPAQVVFEAAILCHYCGDISVPLHTSANHDGQETGQHGVHRRWETGLVERIAKEEDWVPELRPAQLGPDPKAAPWAWLLDSYNLVPGLLADDLSAQDKSSLRGGDRMGQAYWGEFLTLQEPHVKEQLTLAAQRTAQMILFAWSNAGRPLVPSLKLR